MNNTFLFSFILTLLIIIGVIGGYLIITGEIPVNEVNTYTEKIINQTIVNQVLVQPTHSCMKVSQDNGEFKLNCREI